MNNADAMVIYKRFIRLVEETLRNGGPQYVPEDVNAAIGRLGGINSALAQLCYESVLKDLEAEGYKFCKGCKVQLDDNYYLSKCVICWNKLYGP